MLGEPFEDAAGNKYSPLVNQPMIVLSGGAEAIRTIYQPAMERARGSRSTSKRCLQPAMMRPTALR
jgi:hypothetical protein